MSFTLFPLTAAGGNSRLARSARAKLQPRDRYGRWIETGRGVFGKMRFPDGTIKSVIGKAVGGVPNPSNPSNPFVQMYVQGNNDGLKDGFYTLTPGNAQGNLVATLKDSDVKDAGGKDVDGNSVGERADKDIPNADDPNIFAELPYGVQSAGDGSYTYDDYTLREDANGAFSVYKGDEQIYGGADVDWADALASIDRDEDGEAQPEWTPADAQSAPENADAPEATTPASGGGVDTDTFDVAKEGFIVPTGKRAEGVTPESLAAFVGQNKEALGKGGTRIVIDTDDNSAEIYNSADTFDNARAQAGGMGQSSAIDLSTGETVNTDTDQKESTQNGEDSGTDAVESGGTEPGATAPVESDRPTEDSGTQQPAAGEQPAAAPAGGDNDARVAELEAKVSALTEKFSNTVNDRARDRIEGQIEDLQRQIEEIHAAVTDQPQQEEQSAPEPEAEADQVDELEDRVAELETELESYRAEAEAAREALDNAGEDAGVDEQERDDIARADLEEMERITEEARAARDENPDLDELRAKLAGEPAPKRPARKPAEGKLTAAEKRKLQGYDTLTEALRDSTYAGLQNPSNGLNVRASEDNRKALADFLDANPEMPELVRKRRANATASELDAEQAKLEDRLGDLEAMADGDEDDRQHYDRTVQNVDGYEEANDADIQAAILDDIRDTRREIRSITDRLAELQGQVPLDFPDENEPEPAAEAPAAPEAEAPSVLADNNLAVGDSVEWNAPGGRTRTGEVVGEGRGQIRVRPDKPQRGEPREFLVRPDRLVQPQDAAPEAPEAPESVPEAETDITDAPDYKKGYKAGFLAGERGTNFEAAAERWEKKGDDAAAGWLDGYKDSSEGLGKGYSTRARKGELTEEEQEFERTAGNDSVPDPEYVEYLDWKRDLNVSDEEFSRRSKVEFAEWKAQQTPAEEQLPEGVVEQGNLPAGETASIGIPAMEEGQYVRVDDEKNLWSRVVGKRKVDRKRDAGYAGRRPETVSRHVVTLENGDTLEANTVNGREGWNPQRYEVLTPNPEANTIGGPEPEDLVEEFDREQQERRSDESIADADAQAEAQAPEWEQSGVPAAEAYDAMEHDPTNPEVQASYAALEPAIIDQYRRMKAAGIDIQFQQDDPYDSSAAMQQDVEQNRTLKVFADGGATLPADHPMNKTVDVDGESIHLNDLFRGVHDYMGHVASGERGAVVGFGPKGEWEAWRTHRQTLPRESWMALWDETRGQNTWTNYANDHASMPIADRPFAEQKAGVVGEDQYAADLIGDEGSVEYLPEAPAAAERNVQFVDPTPWVDPDGVRWSDGVAYENGKDRSVEPNPSRRDLTYTPRDEETFRGDYSEYPRDVLDQMVEEGMTDLNDFSEPDERDSDELAKNAYDELQYDGGYDAAKARQKWDTTNRDPAYWSGYADGAEEAGLPWAASARDRANYLAKGHDPDGIYSPFQNDDHKAIKEFPGVGTDKRLDVNEDAEPTNSAAIYELMQSQRRPDAPSDEVFPTTTGTADNIDGPVDSSPEDVANAPTGAPELPEDYDFGYEDSDEDYADEKFMPTAEQRNIVKAVLGKNNVAVQALAGTGKTSTLELMARQIAKVDPKAKILYIAFNKSVQEEAQARMPSNVEARTGDSLGFTVSRDITKKFNAPDAIRNPNDVAEFLGIPAKVDLGEGVSGDTIWGNARDVATDLDKVITNFAISEDDKIGPKHFEAVDLPHTPETQAWADAWWADLNDKNGQLRIRNDHITKIWALGNPDLSKPGSGPKSPATIIFFDEAQDINPVMAKVVRDQTIQKVYVGDGRQAIYGFRGAENELDKVEVDVTLPLTQSWRFGPEVAGYGNRYLSLIDSPYKIVGGGAPGEIVEPGSMMDPDAILTRSNAGAVKSILQQLDLGRSVGADAKFKSDLQALIQTVQFLKDRSRKKPRMHEDLAGYKDWDEVIDDVETGKANAKVKMLHTLVEKQGIDTLQRAVDGLKVVGKGEAGPADAPGKIDFKPGAKGVFMPGTPNQWGRAVPVNYEISQGAGGRLRMDLLNSFNIKEDLKRNGFRFDGAKKSWFKEAPAADLEEISNDVRGNVEAPVDVVVSTAHKAKGLEWGKVKIGDDFRGAERKEDEDGNEYIEWPEPEELRLAYVAVTRAQSQLDPGSLSWVTAFTDKEDEDPRNPSRGLPNDDGEYEEQAPELEPLPTREEPTPEPEPEVAPEPEIAPLTYDPITPENPRPVSEMTEDELQSEELELDNTIRARINAAGEEGVNERDNERQIELWDELDRRRRERRAQEEQPEVAPEPTPEPETVPEPTPAPEVVPEPEEEPESDGLPDTIEELEDLAGRLEVQIAGARPARQRVLQREVDRIYDKIDALSEPEGDEDPSEVELPGVPNEPRPEWIVDATPEPWNVEPAPATVEDRLPKERPEGAREATRSVLDNIAAGKDLEGIEDVLTEDDPDGAVARVVLDRPNAANTVTRPRREEEINRELDNADPAILAVENDPLQIVDPNLIWEDVQRTNPGHTKATNGDLILQKKEVNGRTYELVVRRTPREKFFAFVKETDKDGNQRIIRMRNGRGKNNSYRGLLTQLDRGKKLMAKQDPKREFDRRRSTVEKIEAGQEVGNGLFGGLIDGTDLPESVDEGYNRVVAAIAKLVEDPDISTAILETLATEKGYDAGLVDVVRLAVARRRFEEAYEAPNTDAPTHIGYDNVPLEVGQWADWTDIEKTIPLKDENGNTVYETDANGNYVLSRAGKPIPVSIPNPNYGRVYRGYVKSLTYKAGDKYKYSDSVQFIIPELNKEKGWKPSRQVPRIASKLRPVANQNAPKSAPFWPETNENFRDQAVPPLANPEGRRQEKDPAPRANVATAADFDVPVEGNETKPRNEPEAVSEYRPYIEGFNGTLPVHDEAFNIRLPENPLDATFLLDGAETVKGSRQDIRPGTFLPAGPDGNSDYVVSVAHGPEATTVKVVNFDEQGNYVDRFRTFKGDAQLLMFRPLAFEIEADAVNNNKTTLASISRRALLGKKGSPSLKAAMNKIINDPSSTLEDIVAVREDIASMRNQGNAKGSVIRIGAVDNALEELKGLRDKYVGANEKPDLGDIEDAQKALAQDKVALEGHDANWYRNNINLMDNADFAKIHKAFLRDEPETEFTQAQVTMSELKPGDIINAGFWGGWQDIGYAQVIKVGKINEDTGKVMVHYRALANTENPHAIMKAKGVVDVVPGQMFLAEDWADQPTFAFRPTAEIRNGYFKDPSLQPPKMRTPRQLPGDYNDLTPDDPSRIEKSRKGGQDLMKSFEKGFTATASRADKGALNIEAAIGETADGRKVFTKLVSGQDELAAEVLAVRVYNVLGGEDNYIGYYEDKRAEKGKKKNGMGKEFERTGYRIVLPQIEGDPGREFEYSERDLVDDLAENESAIRMGLLDLLVANMDRHPGNYMVLRKDGKPVVVPIDHELSMSDMATLTNFSAWGTKLLNLIREGKAPLTSAQLLRIKNNLSGLRSEFVQFDREAEFVGMMERLNKIIDGVNGHVI